MDTMKRIEKCGVVPVVVLKKVEEALPTAKALLAGGVDIMEITLRTDAGIESIRTVAAQCPDVCVGAGTVTTLQQCKQVVEAGAKFIVSPGFDPELVKWCVDNNVPTMPGCVTPTEIMGALKLGVNIVKFFPANIYGGIPAMKALAGPFGNVKFVPTGGVSEKNLEEYIGKPFIFAVGGSWLCAQSDISEGNFEKIKSLAAHAAETKLKCGA